MRKAFTDKLLKWHRHKNDRKMPWKGEKDPYKVWLSEIILQQTRVEQGRAYYERFVQTFPTIRQLARAKDQAVFKLWEGLGYYSRCRNLLETARRITEERGGVFPDNYKEILQLKGIGPYTAAAIASFAFGLPYAVVDGNVQRVLARYHGISQPVDSKEGKEKIEALASELLNRKSPGEYNQAIMDFGATVCKPQQPLCTACVQRTQCVAFQQGRVNDFPVKTKSIRIRDRWFNYYIFISEKKVAVRPREAKDIWQGLHEFMLVEQLTPFADPPTASLPSGWLNGRGVIHWRTGETYKQSLSHQRIHVRFYIGMIEKKDRLQVKAEWLSKQQLSKRPFPVVIQQFMQDELLSAALL